MFTSHSRIKLEINDREITKELREEVIMEIGKYFQLNNNK